MERQSLNKTETFLRIVCQPSNSSNLASWLQNFPLLRTPAPRPSTYKPSCHVAAIAWSPEPDRGRGQVDVLVEEVGVLEEDVEVDGVDVVANLKMMSM